MAKGKIKRVANLGAKVGAAPSYLFMKVQAEWSGREEYLLMTENEVDTAAERAEKNSDDIPDLSRGVFTRVDNKNARAGANSYYIAVRAQYEDSLHLNLMFTEHEMEYIRLRVENNAEDIEANRESWLADLLD